MDTIQMLKQSNRINPFLYMAFDLGKSQWSLAFFDGRKKRHRAIPARSMEALKKEIRLTCEKFKLPFDIQVVSCFEAGRDGFWLHRQLLKEGVANVVVDSSSIEVKRRARRVKTDKVDASTLVRMLYRHTQGEDGVWSVLYVPTEVVEDDRRLHREMGRLQKEQTAHTNRIKALLFNQGIVIENISTDTQWLSLLTTGDGAALGERIINEITRELKRLHCVREQIKEVQQEKKRVFKEGHSESIQKARKLMQLKGVGPISSWTLSYEFLWRNFENRKQVASAAGLAPSSYQSGLMDHDLGISKAGNRRVRSLMVELSWLWLRYQPQSELSQWYAARFEQGNRRSRKVGIVALARKLLIALWKWAERGELPLGALLKEASY